MWLDGLMLVTALVLEVAMLVVDDSCEAMLRITHSTGEQEVINAGYNKQQKMVTLCQGTRKNKIRHFFEDTVQKILVSHRKQIIRCCLPCGDTSCAWQWQDEDDGLWHYYYPDDTLELERHYQAGKKIVNYHLNASDEVNFEEMTQKHVATDISRAIKRVTIPEGQEASVEKVVGPLREDERTDNLGGESGTRFYDKTGKGEDRESGKHDLQKIDLGAKENPDVEKLSTKQTSQPNSKLHPRVLALMQLIFNKKLMGEVVIEMKYDVEKCPLAELTVHQINCAYLALQEIQEILRSNEERSTLDKASADFYTRIPHNFGMTTPTLIQSTPDIREKRY